MIRSLDGGGPPGPKSSASAHSAACTRLGERREKRYSIAAARNSRRVLMPIAIELVLMIEGHFC